MHDSLLNAAHALSFELNASSQMLQAGSNALETRMQAVQLMTAVGTAMKCLQTVPLPDRPRVGLFGAGAGGGGAGMFGAQQAVAGSLFGAGAGAGVGVGVPDMQLHDGTPVALGMYVLAVDSERFGGVIVKANQGNTLTVKWDGGDVCYEVKPGKLKLWRCVQGCGNEVGEFERRAGLCVGCW